MSQPTVTREQKQASRDAKVAHYDSIRRRYHRRAEQTLASLREALETAERRITSTDALDRRLLGDSANTIAREAADLVESAAAWGALDEVSYFAEPVPSDTGLASSSASPEIPDC
jgi:hypothetical protein